MPSCWWPKAGRHRRRRRPGAGSSHHRTMGVGLRGRADRGFPPVLDEAQQAELKGGGNCLTWLAVRTGQLGRRLVRQFLLERSELVCAASRPELPAAEASAPKLKATRPCEARTGAIFFVHFRAFGEWVLKGEPALAVRAAWRRGRWNGSGGEQQRRKLRGFPGTVEERHGHTPAKRDLLAGGAGGHTWRPRA